VHDGFLAATARSVQTAASGQQPKSWMKKPSLYEGHGFTVP
jgi:hypothetical protein